MHSKSTLFLLAAMLAVSTTASADDHRDRVWSNRDPRPHYAVRRGPPGLRHEYMGLRPSYRHVWVSGCWRWSNGYSDWVWAPGYWAIPPYEGVVYVAPTYEQTPSGVVYVEGGWCEPTYARSNNAAAGTVIGGVVGGVIGHQSHRTGVGVLLGAVVGGLVGHESDEREAEQRYQAAQARANQAQIARAQANANAELEKQKLIAQGSTISDDELAAAQQRARVAKAKLAAAKSSQQSDLGRAAALERANAEAEAAEAELQTLKR